MHSLEAGRILWSEMLVQEQRRTGELLRTLFEATAPAIGDQFFNALARHLADVLEVRLVFVAEALEGGLSARTLALWIDGGFRKNVQYAVPGTPCETVLAGKIVQIPDRLNELYPEEDGMLGGTARSYLGIPLVGRSGMSIGHVVAMDTKAMVEKVRDFSTFEAFGIRATAELERRNAEQALARAQASLIQAERMAALGQLTASVAHEINGPIGAIRSSIDLIAGSIDRLKRTIDAYRGDGDSEAQRCLRILGEGVETSRQASARIGDMVTTLRTFTALDEAPRRPVDIHEAIDSALGLLRPTLGKDVKVVRNFGEIAEVQAEPAQLNQVFMTLLRNANEAIEGAGTIKITTSGDHRLIFIKIADDGRGIPPSEQMTLFDVGLSTSGSRVGMRVGLASAYSVVKAHGGQIDVKSEVGVGTEVTIQLPALPDEASADRA